MLPALLTRGLTPFLIGLAILNMGTTTSLAKGEEHTLSETSMTQAIRYLGMLRGREIALKDGDWLRQQWAEEHKTSPGAVAVQVDELAFQFERLQEGQDPIALADGRTTVMKNAYCTAEQTSDPLRHRLGDILAPDDVVLAADCLLGLVVTRFDVDGLVASHALTADETGQGHDEVSDRAEVVGIIEQGFVDAAPADRALLANGELRHAVLARFWSRIDGVAEQRAVIEEIRGAAATDLRGPARQLENLALSKLGEVDYLAKVGDARLTVGAIGAYTEWLERIAGAGFSGRDRAWLERAITAEFQGDPGKTLSEIAGIKEANTNYRTTDGADVKNELVAGWAASLYCYLSASSKPDERHLAEIVFQHDPVIEADCQAGRIIRERHAVLAEAKGQRLMQQDVDGNVRFMSMILGRPLLSEERAVIRDDDIQSFKKDPDAWREVTESYGELLEKVERRGETLFLAVDDRKKLFDPIYCALKVSDDPYADEYLKMFQRDDAILYENCEQQFVTTEDEIDAIVGLGNFLTLLNERPPLSQAEVYEVRQTLTSENMDGAESSMSALGEWWSLLTLEEKAAAAADLQKNGITPDADSGTIASFINEKKGLVVLENVNRRTCQMMAIISQGNTNIFAAKQGRYAFNTNGDPAGFPGEDYATLVTTNNMFAEFCS